jgi:hypothetical protein
MKFKTLKTDTMEYVINIEAISAICSHDGSEGVAIYFYDETPLKIMMPLSQLIKKLELM